MLQMFRILPVFELCVRAGEEGRAKKKITLKGTDTCNTAVKHSYTTLVHSHVIRVIQEIFEKDHQSLLSIHCIYNKIAM